MRILAFDLETDRLLCKTRDDHRDLRVTVGQFCEFDWEPADAQPTGMEWTEYVDGEDGASLGELVAPLMERADRIVAYNGRGFDMPVLRGCDGVADADVDRWTKKLRDPFEAIRDATGSWVKLDELLYTNDLPFRKSGDGVSAVAWWADGETRRVADYCRDDVEALMVLIALDRIAFPIKSWRMQVNVPEARGDEDEEDEVEKRARTSVHVVTGWAELEWRAYLFG